MLRRGFMARGGPFVIAIVEAAQAILKEHPNSRITFASLAKLGLRLKMRVRHVI